MTDRLTASERALIVRARELAGADAPVYLRHYLRQHGHVLSTWEATDEVVYTICFGDAQDLLRQLVDLAERLGSESAP